MRRGLVWGVLLLWAVVADPSAAALKKYRLNTIDLVARFGNTPLRERAYLIPSAGTRPRPPFDTAWIKTGGAGSPVLTKFRFRTSVSTTVDASSIFPGSFVFLRTSAHEGPGPLAKPASFTGTGDTGGGSAIRWGVVTGWTITGAHFCHSFPPTLCELLTRRGEADHLKRDTTVDPPLQSPFYDLGTWFFHSTGFTAIPFVRRYNDVAAETPFHGNTQRWIRGTRVLDATVPALPLVGVALLGASLVVGAGVSLRRRRR